MGSSSASTGSVAWRSEQSRSPEALSPSDLPGVLGDNTRNRKRSPSSCLLLPGPKLRSVAVVFSTRAPSWGHAQRKAVKEALASQHELHAVTGQPAGAMRRLSTSNSWL